MVVLLAVLGLGFLGAAIHPFVTYPLTLLVLRRWRHAPAVGLGEPAGDVSFALCFCAYNEERVIEEKVRNLAVLRGLVPRLEVLAYVDAATDRTAELLRPYADWIKLHVSPERHGKTYGMNRLVSLAEADILVFTDANVMLDLEALVNLRRYFSDPQVGCVCGHLIYVNAGDSPTASVGSLYWRLEEWIKQQETLTGSVMGADGSLFAIRRSCHHPVPNDLIDDAFLSYSILCDGYRVVRAGNVRAFEESVPASIEEFRRKVRIGCQSFNVHRVLWRRLRRLDGLSLYKYVSHKWLRWVSIYSLALGAALLGMALVLAGHAAIAVGLAAAAGLAVLTGARYRVPLLSQMWEILLSLVATGIGVWRSIRGEHFRTWTPASSVRAKTAISAPQSARTKPDAEVPEPRR
jgi:cellulose synthase/poly-beta-1,6-N-acetylglucosamine synthase-like glycosyltransferase